MLCVPCYEFIFWHFTKVVSNHMLFLLFLFTSLSKTDKSLLILLMVFNSIHLIDNSCVLLLIFCIKTMFLYHSYCSTFRCLLCVIMISNMVNIAIPLDDIKYDFLFTRLTSYPSCVLNISIPYTLSSVYIVKASGHGYLCNRLQILNYIIWYLLEMIKIWNYRDPSR